MLATYEPEEVVALLSCFVFQEKTDIEPVFSPKLLEGRNALLAIADKVGAVQDRHSVQAADAEAKLKFGLVEVVYEWAKGMVSLSCLSSLCFPRFYRGKLYCKGSGLSIDFFFELVLAF